MNNKTKSKKKLFFCVIIIFCIFLIISLWKVLVKLDVVLNINIPYNLVVSGGKLDLTDSLIGKIDNLSIYKYNNSKAGMLKNWVSKCSNWHSFPLPDGLQKLVYKKIVFGTVCIPEVEEGYWIYQNRSVEGTSAYEYNNEDLESSDSKQITIGIYDTKNNLLYIYQVDT